VSPPTPAEAIFQLPSITTWTRLEPLPREASMQQSLQAQVRDPLWFLCRQWQVGEFLGDDAGSPVQATLSVEQRGITTYRPGTAVPGPLDPGLPVEVHAERETVALRLRGAVQSGLRFEKLVKARAGASAGGVIAAFREAFPIAAAPPDPAFADGDGRRYRTLAAGRVTDGEALYLSALAVANGQAPPRPLPAVAAEPPVAAALGDFVAYRQALFSEPAAAADASWQSGQQAYGFALGSPTPDRDLSLRAAAFPGGHLDWYSFDVEAGAAAVGGAPGAAGTAGAAAAAGAPGAAGTAGAAAAAGAAPAGPAAVANPAPVNTADFNFLPHHVVFRGMPDPRWWNFEDGATDFGQLDAEHVDLAKLLVMEFALVYDNDWFWLPVPTPVGTLARVTTLVVTDTFGVRTLIRPAEQTTVSAGAAPWSMFKLSGAAAASPGAAATRSDFILMPPTLGVVEDAGPLEEVVFLRDDMAAMAWAVENCLPGDLDAPVDAYEMYLQRLRGLPPEAPPPTTQDGPRVSYTLEVPVPDNWIPMVPVQSPQGELFLRRGLFANAALGVAPARAVLLEPQHAFLLADRVLPRAGLQVDRYFRRTRSPGGNTFVWLARRATPGRGPGWSGLRFDLVRDLPPPPDAA
jgi:hypothetical protein